MKDLCFVYSELHNHKKLFLNSTCDLVYINIYNSNVYSYFLLFKLL